MICVLLITSLVKLKENDLWIDCASNDGTLLSYVPQNLIRVGIDPADDTFKVESEDLSQRLRNLNNMLYRYRGDAALIDRVQAQVDKLEDMMSTLKERNAQAIMKRDFDYLSGLECDGKKDKKGTKNA